jgi:hypothetical protein
MPRPPKPSPYEADLEKRSAALSASIARADPAQVGKLLCSSYAAIDKSRRLLRDTSAAGPRTIAEARSSAPTAPASGLREST